MSVGSPGKHSVSERDAVIDELKIQGKGQGENQTWNKTNNTGMVDTGIVGNQERKPNSTQKSNSNPFVNPINQTNNKTNNTGMTVNTGTVGKQEGKPNSTQKSKSTPFISSFWVLVAMLGAVTYVRKTK